MTLAKLFELEPHGNDVLVGEGHPYAWGGLYGGHIVTQALNAAAHTVDPEYLPHSLRAYFIRRGDNAATVRYEVDRIREGRSFITRRVVARQSVGAILNLEASFQKPENSTAITTVSMPENIPMPDDIAHSQAFSEFVEERPVPRDTQFTDHRDGAGRIMTWYRALENFGGNQLLNRCALAYMSDDLPVASVVLAVPELRQHFNQFDELFCASLDHTIWFHRDVDASQWHLFEMNCHSYTSNRGVSFGYVFAQDGTHVATVAQEALVRLRNDL